MRFSGTITVQYDTPFSPFTVSQYREGLDWLAANRFDGAEICISNYENLDVNRLKEELDQRNLGCSTISTGQARGLEDISLLHEGAALQKAQERMRQHIDAAGILGSKVTLGLLRGLGTPGKEEEEKRILAKNLKPVIDYADQKKITIVLEAINRYETSLLNSVETVMDFIERDLGKPECIGVLWDVFHANIEDAGFCEAIDRMGGRLQHVHFADSNRMVPGYGHMDFDNIVRYLKTQGYGEYISFECLNQPSIAAARSELGEFVKKMRKL